MAPPREHANGLSFGGRSERRGTDAGRAADSGDRPVQPSEAIDLLVRRSDFLSELIDGPTRKPALQSELDVSRSTVYKAIRELEESHLVERAESGYRVTLAGRLLFDQYRRFREAAEAVSEPASLLSELPPDAPVSIDFLDGAEAIRAEPHAPYYPIRAFEEFVDRSTRLRGASPVVLPSLVELYREQAASGERPSELILNGPLIERLLSDYAETFRETLAAGRLTVRKADRRLPIGLLVADEPATRVAVLVSDSRGEFRGLLLNDTERAYDWATDAWELFCDRSTDVTDETLRAVGGDPDGRPSDS